VTPAVAQMVDKSANTLTIDLASPAARDALNPALKGDTQIIVTYSYGKYKNVAFASAALTNKTLRIAPPKNDDAQDGATAPPAAPLVIEKAAYGLQPSATTGWLVAVCFVVFIAAFASGPGVVVWLALSELMPTRIRSNGMSIALFINQFVSTTIAAIFLPVVGAVGYSTMFFVWAGFTVIYFCTAAFVMPETKGRTLEEIEEHFEGKRKLP
jgi:phage shock protein PspC (stress-responsive transcriptional regulator)